MSTEELEFLTDRLKEELTRLGLKGAEAARRIGEKDANRMKQVLSGRQRLSAEMLAKLVSECGVNGHYVLTGQRLPGIDIPSIEQVFQLISDADTLLNQTTPPEQRVAAAMALLQSLQLTGDMPQPDAAVAVLMMHKT